MYFSVEFLPCKRARFRRLCVVVDCLPWLFWVPYNQISKVALFDLSTTLVNSQQLCRVIRHPFGYSNYIMIIRSIYTHEWSSYVCPYCCQCVSKTVYTRNSQLEVSRRWLLIKSYYWIMIGRYYINGFHF